MAVSCSTNRYQKSGLTCTELCACPVLCSKMIVMNILMTMMKVTIAMIVQVMMMKTINVVNYVFITLLMGD